MRSRGGQLGSSREGNWTQGDVSNLLVSSDSPQGRMKLSGSWSSCQVEIKLKGRKTSIQRCCMKECTFASGKATLGSCFHSDSNFWMYVLPVWMNFSLTETAVGCETTGDTGSSSSAERLTVGAYRAVVIAELCKGATLVKLLGQFFW
jgi:hypothetical protein